MVRILTDERIPVPYVPRPMVPMGLNAFADFEGFTAEEKSKIDYKNALELFPTLKDKFPDLK